MLSVFLRSTPFALFGAILSLLALSGVGAADSDIVVDDSLPISTRKWSGLILTHARVSEDRAVVIVDTGSSLSYIQPNSNRKWLHNYPTQTRTIRTAGGIIEKRVYGGVPVSASSAQPRLLDVGEFDSATLWPLSTWNLEGVIGMNYLNSFSLVITGHEGRAEICDVDGVRRPNHPPIRLRYSAKLPQVSITLPGGLALDVVIDTGMTGACTLPTNVLNQLVRTGHARLTRPGTDLTGAGEREVKRAIVRRIEFADITFTDIIVSESEMATIGLGFLEHFNTLIDFRSHEAWFVPVLDSKFIPCPPDATGLFITFTPEKLAHVRRIMPGYPGETSGITPDDELLTVDGIPIAEFSLMKLRERFSQAGKTVHLKLKSGEREYEVDLKLDRPFEYPPKWEPEDPNEAPRPFPKLDE